ncbi:hypothetical protein A2866_05540 [Candidatus Roizmanbacteria bacterium RIFCSPHIGHO2_01_FULL_39_8]|uniref:Sugar O-methyltransferase n=3 Tax=Candidatus Roizmaniibacteriota TaxID=1752723 RepID=A0A1F7GG69_9BACT|nr:MAG: hypothetical protein A2866_05540 [Candidatus Roizmanbacteria bacterium RIFCSPHIGHO2_01_FULL_39_8]OGK26592.1 MAG: hypothetical protein A3C28_03750 [Candidatus Roizmanbacteria bacterium RIFCSPHIGHO2_02_FULL_39_9]OGK37809.1 MAG: hypothetical protein A3F60_00070 [Candidatus Roizmanbacteria bacterium RIFCSPHIGHO2_12_FULL_39_8]
MKKKLKTNVFLKRIEEMFFHLAKGKGETQPSKFWLNLNSLHMKELIEEGGYQNFKQTLVRKYFANTPFFFMNRQTLFLILNVNPLVTVSTLLRSILNGKHKNFTLVDSWSFSFLSLMVWEFAKKYDHKNLLDKLEEPLFGNPPRIYLDNKLISQDTGNSVLEYYSIMDSVGKNRKIKVIAELGAGSGRNAFVFISVLPGVKYIIIDIPPALAISERYLSDVFPNKKIFRFRTFKKFSEVKNDFEKSDILFFLSSQIELLPKNIADLFINISSLHEMRMSQVKFYFKQIVRLTKKNGLFYFKQWKEAYVDHENIYIRTKDYPITNAWEKIYIREAKIQVKFFEALLKRK